MIRVAIYARFSSDLQNDKSVDDQIAFCREVCARNGMTVVLTFEDIGGRTRYTALVRHSAGMENVPDAVWKLTLSQWAHTHVPGLQRVAQPEEIAAFALVLASDDLPYMTGAQLVMDGGKTAHAG